MDFFRIPREAYTATKGFYDQTLTREKNAQLEMGLVSLAHIDCDLYKSTLSCLQFVQENLQQGTVILFDDYYCCQGNLGMGESGAFSEWLSGHPEWTANRWFDYSIHGKAFILTRP